MKDLSMEDFVTYLGENQKTKKVEPAVHNKAIVDKINEILIFSKEVNKRVDVLEKENQDLKLKLIGKGIEEKKEEIEKKEPELTLTEQVVKQVKEAEAKVPPPPETPPPIVPTPETPPKEEPTKGTK